MNTESTSLFSFFRRTRSWKPKWSLPPAPRGEDEAYAEALYEAHVRTLGREAVRQPSWDSLPEWKRESWRREYRDA